MSRLTLIPFVLILSLLIFGVVSFYIIKKLKQVINFLRRKTSEIIQKRQQEKTRQEQQQKLPDIVKNGQDQYKQLQQNHAKLPMEWKNLLQPLLDDSKLLLDEIVESFNLNDVLAEQKFNSIRSFFNHTLDALVQFSEKLNDNHQTMSAEQREKAQQNITAFKADLLRHQEALWKIKCIDFDVSMDVIKERLKK